MSRSLQVCGIGVSAADIAGFAKRFGYAAVPNPAQADIVLVSSPDRVVLQQALSTRPPFAVIETPAPDQAFGERLNRALSAQGLFLSLRTQTAFNAELTTLICGACAKAIGLTDERRMDIETAVEEALSNAMVHGNLDIASVLRNDPADFELYCDLVNERLATLPYADRRLELLAVWTAGKVDIEVHDEGRGYDIGSIQSLPQVEAKCGRGFSLIRELAQNITVGEHGRSLTMSFST